MATTWRLTGRKTLGIKIFGIFRSMESLVGLVGAGRTDFARILFGADRCDSGWMTSDEGRQFVAQSGDAWREASIAAGTDPAAAHAAAERVYAFYTAEPEAPAESPAESPAEPSA